MTIGSGPRRLPAGPVPGPAHAGPRPSAAAELGPLAVALARVGLSGIVAVEQSPLLTVELNGASL